VLRALVVLPTRDLAAQVFSVLHSLGSAAGVSVVLTAAQESVAAEAEKLAAHPSRPSSSGPHVLVATPGRLLAHLQASGSSSSITGVSLAHLRFLVVDEADRLLRQDYQGWLPQVLANIRSSSPHGGGGGIMQEGVPWQQQAFSSRSLPWLEQPVSTSSSTSSRVLKLVVSATLTRDPSKLQRLELACPRYIALTGVDRRYALPPALRQHRIVVPAQHKPLALVALLSQLTTAGGAAADGAPCGRCLVFASSLDTTHR
jgi:ATP-dependent RNA helicase DDX51/DBP6